MRKAVRVIFALVLLSLVCSLGIDAGGGDLARARTSETFVSPPEIVSSNGVLNATLTAGTAMVKIGTKDVLARVYDGLYVPPTLRVRPGDTIKLRLVNTLGTPTSLHYHGLEVSPRGRSDNVFVHLGTSEVLITRSPSRETTAPGCFGITRTSMGCPSRRWAEGCQVA